MRLSVNTTKESQGINNGQKPAVFRGNGRTEMMYYV